MNKIFIIAKETWEVAGLLLAGFVAGFSLNVFLYYQWLLWALIILALLSWVIMKVIKRRNPCNCPCCGRFLESKKPKKK